jgi:hypothetical protein
MWMLEGWSTEERGEHAVRYRAYTTSEKRAAEFEQIPKLQFSDSGHGVVFSAIPCTGRRKDKPEKRDMHGYVSQQLAILRARK